MKTFFVRFAFIIFLIILGSVVSALSSVSSVSLVLYFLSVAFWVLILDFRKALWPSLPLLFAIDILWDGKVGEVFFFGFLLMVATTYLAVRVDARGVGTKVFIFGLLGFFFSLASAFLSVGEEQQFLWFFSWQVIFWHAATTLFLALPLYLMLEKMELWLENGRRKEFQNVR